MKAKNLVVCFAVLAFALMLGNFVSAGDITNVYAVEVEGIDAYANHVSVIAGEEITVKVYFISLVDDTDVTIEAELEGEKVKVTEITSPFDVETGATYKKTLTLKVPSELKDKLSADDLLLSITIDGKQHKSILADILLKVQRPSYDAVIKSITVPSSIKAGDSAYVDFVLKNMGYNDLEDVYVEVSITELGISQGPKWVGDLVNIENCSNDECDEDDTVSGRLYLDIPYGVADGAYDLKLTVYNDDTESSKVKQVYIKNGLSKEIITTSMKKSANVGEEIQFTFLIVNPTNNVKVYTINSESTGDVATTTDQTVVAVSAGSSKTVTITAKAMTEGSKSFGVNVLENGKVVETMKFELDASGSTKVAKNSTLILTIILAVVFLILVIVLIVLLARKPEKSEEISESYY